MGNANRELEDAKRAQQAQIEKLALLYAQVQEAELQGAKLAARVEQAEAKLDNVTVEIAKQASLGKPVPQVVLDIEGFEEDAEVSALAKSAGDLQKQLSEMATQLQQLVANRRAASTAVESEQEIPQHERPEATPPEAKRIKPDEQDGDIVFGDALEDPPTPAKTAASSSKDDPKHLEAIRQKAKDRQATLEKAKVEAEAASKQEATRFRTWGKQAPPSGEQRV